MKAFCWRSGTIGFGRCVPREARAIATAPGRALRKQVCALARHAYDGTTMLVPGIPEATDDLSAERALRAFRERVLKALARKEDAA